MTEVSEQSSATNEPLANDAASQLTKANKYAFSLWTGLQNVLLDEMMFAGNEFLERAIAEESKSPTNSSPSWRKHTRSRTTLADVQECTKHQLAFIRRDTEQLLKHSDRLIDKTSKLVETWRQTRPSAPPGRCTIFPSGMLGWTFAG